MYYPNQRHALAATTFRRERLLPEEALGTVETQRGQRVDINTIIARGAVPERYVVVDAAAFFKLKNPDDLEELLLVDLDEVVDENQPLAGKSAAKGKRLLSPVMGIVAEIDHGTIIIKGSPQMIDVEAGLNGQVVSIHSGRGAVIEATGALIQGAWGNGQRVIGTLRPEPAEGLENIVGDELDMPYRGSLLIIKLPLTARGMLVMQNQGINGVIAPSMSPDLRELAQEIQGAIMLTEGFGKQRMNTIVSGLLNDFIDHQGMLDAALPSRWHYQRPELVINVASSSEQAPAASLRATLAVGNTVRLTRDPYAGTIGEIVDLPKTPTLLDNGLRVPGASVRLVTGATVSVPLANIEVFG